MHNIALQKARNSHRQEPDPRMLDDQPVDWWSLRKAGFELQRYDEPLRDERWKVDGNPWRVLRRGSVRIPVFRMQRFDPKKKKNIYPQHYARIAAYCHLLKTCEGAESPYGIVLHGFTYKGTAIKNTPEASQIFHNALLYARDVILQRRQPKPPSPHLCYSCHHAKIPYTDRNEDDEEFYAGEDSPCAEKFNWQPPSRRT